MVEYVLANKLALLELGLAVLGVASIVARLTPTQADNKVLAVMLKFVHLFGLTK